MNILEECGFRPNELKSAKVRDVGSTDERRISAVQHTFSHSWILGSSLQTWCLRLVGLDKLVVLVAWSLLGRQALLAVLSKGELDRIAWLGPVG